MVSRPIICGDGRDDLRRQVTQLLVIDRTALCPPIIWCTRDREANNNSEPACKKAYMFRTN